MKLSRKAIDEFKAIYLAEFGKQITDDEALKMGWNLLCLYRLLLEPEQSASTEEQPNEGA